MRSEITLASEVSPLDRVVEAVPVALVAALPTFLRARAAHADVETSLTAFALAFALTAPAAYASIALLRRAREGARAVLGDTGILAAGLTVAAAALTVAFWQRLGSFLAHATHHRGLGGVAFAAGALALAVAVAVFARGAHRVVAPLGPALATFVGVAGLFTPLLALFAGRAPSAPAPSSDPLGLLVVDGLGLLVASFAWVQHFAPRSWPPRARVLVGLGTLMLAFSGLAFLRMPIDSGRENLAFLFGALPLR